MRRQIVLVAASTALILALAVVAAVVLRPPATSRATTSCPVRSPATCATGSLPPLDLASLGGGRVDAASYRGKIVVVNFWNYDCPPCRREMPAIEQAWASLRGRGVVVIGLMYVGGDWPHDLAATRAFLAKYGITYPVAIDSGSKLATAMGIPGIPTTFVADSAGRLRFRVAGQLAPGQLQHLVALVRGS